MVIGPREEVDMAAWDAWRAAQRFAEIARKYPGLVGANEMTQAGAAIVYLEEVITGLRKVAAE